MFRRRADDSVTAVILPPVEPVAVRLEDDTHTFQGQDGTVYAEGFEVSGNDEHWYLDEEEAVDDYGLVFYFKVAGISHHQHQAQGDLCRPGAQLLFIPEPTNEYDHNAVKVCREDGQTVGYVPASLAPSLQRAMRSRRMTGGLGFVTRTYADHRRTRIAIEVIATVDRNLKITATIEDENNYDVESLGERPG